jgi:type I restriction enzyme M protein
MFFLKIIDDQDQELELMQEGYRSPIPAKFRWRTWAADREGMTGEALLAFVNDELFPALKELPNTARDGRRRVVRDVFEDAYNYMKSGEILLDPACGTGGFLTCALRHMRSRYVKTPEDERRMQQALRAVEKKQLPHMLCVTNMLLHGIDDPSFVRHDNTLARPYISYGQSDRVDIVLTNPPFGGREEDGIESNFPKHFQTRETADLFLALIIRLLKPGGRAAVVLPDGTLFGEGVKTRLKEHLLEECDLHTIVRLPNSVFKPYASIGTNRCFSRRASRRRKSGSTSIESPKGRRPTR